MSTQLYKETNYFSGVKFLCSSFIREYDLSKANISSLLYKRVITEEQYKNFYDMDKLYREIIIGNMERKDSKISELKKEGILEARKLLVETNNLEDLDILEIRNDALFILNKELSNTKFGVFDFKMKNVYNLYLFVTKQLQIYYRFDTLQNVDIIDIKGIRPEYQELHREYFIHFLCNTFYYLQNESIEKSIQYITNFYQQYIQFELPVGYYREFNSNSLYKVRNNGIGIDYGFQYIDEKDKRQINIDYNIFIIKTIYHNLSTMYFSKRK